jgi:hypothetical protein
MGRALWKCRRVLVAAWLVSLVPVGVYMYYAAATALERTACLSGCD